jgi:hypothetical protein
MICVSRYIFIFIQTRFQLNEEGEAHMIRYRSQKRRCWLQALLFWPAGKVRAISLAIIGSRLPKGAPRK